MSGVMRTLVVLKRSDAESLTARHNPVQITGRKYDTQLTTSRLQAKEPPMPPPLRRNVFQNGGSRLQKSRQLRRSRAQGMTIEEVCAKAPSVMAGSLQEQIV
jgi:hypothetical protein